MEPKAEVPLDDLLDTMRRLRGELAAIDEVRKTTQATLTALNDEVLRRMNGALAEQFGSEFAPRITFYTDERKAIAKPLVANLTFTEAK